MKSIPQVFLLLLILVVNISCDQTKRIENRLYGCFEAALNTEEKEEVNQILTDFENHLIKRGVLESNKPKSYLKIYETIQKDPEIKFDFDYSLTDKLKKFNRVNNDALLQCHQNIFRSDEYKNSTVSKMNNCIQSIVPSGKTWTAKEKVKCFLKFMKEADFELQYYRQNTLMLIEEMKRR